MGGSDVDPWDGSGRDTGDECDCWDCLTEVTADDYWRSLKQAQAREDARIDRYQFQRLPMDIVP